MLTRFLSWIAVVGFYFINVQHDAIYASVCCVASGIFRIRFSCCGPHFLCRCVCIYLCSSVHLVFISIFVAFTNQNWHNSVCSNIYRLKPRYSWHTQRENANLLVTIRIERMIWSDIACCCHTLSQTKFNCAQSFVRLVGRLVGSVVRLHKHSENVVFLVTFHPLHGHLCISLKYIGHEMLLNVVAILQYVVFSV